jgi:hypothetical protein
MQECCRLAIVITLQLLDDVVEQLFPQSLGASATRSREILTDKTFELGVSPLVRGAWPLLRLSSVACGAIAVVVDTQYAVEVG